MVGMETLQADDGEKQTLWLMYVPDNVRQLTNDAKAHKPCVNYQQGESTAQHSWV